ncbi:MAG: hypothetical protein J0L92_13775 [Deltaproteobacteria bacterium]|nr:hypothetical protein [Deltaproteobacteria bacterium]
MRARLLGPALAFVLLSARASAQTLAPAPAPLPPAPALVDPQPEVSLWYRNFTAGRVNPLGLFELFDLSLRLRLHESDADALKQNFVGVGTTVGLSPAFGRIGVLAEIQPLTLLRLWASYEFVGYFSSFGLMASYPSATSDFSDTAIREGGDRGRPGYTTVGGMLTLGAAFQVRLGPIAIRDTFRAFWSSFDLRTGDRVYFDQTLDLQMPNDGWSVVNEGDVLWVSDFGLVVGARYTVATPLNEDSHFLPLEDRSVGENRVHRLGPLVAYTFERNPNARFDAPTLILLAQWHLMHRFRTGRDVDTGLPYLGLVFQFTGDLLADH